jgi:thioredoxin 1
MKIKLVKEINEPKFAAEVLQASSPILVAFLAGWSKPCQLVEPVLEEIAGDWEGRIKVFKVNVDDNPDLGNAYGIQSVPTLSYFIHGTLRLKIVGMASAKAILGKLESLTQGITPNEGT